MMSNLTGLADFSTAMAKVYPKKLRGRSTCVPHKQDVHYELIDDGWPGYEEPDMQCDGLNVVF